MQLPQSKLTRITKLIAIFHAWWRSLCNHTRGKWDYLIDLRICSTAKNNACSRALSVYYIALNATSLPYNRFSIPNTSVFSICMRELWRYQYLAEGRGASFKGLSSVNNGRRCQFVTSKDLRCFLFNRICSILLLQVN